MTPYTAVALVDGVLRVTFDTPVKGSYSIVTSNSCPNEASSTSTYSLSVITGALDVSTSKATVDSVENGNEFVAGSTSVTFSMVGRDKNNNLVSYTTSE